MNDKRDAVINAYSDLAQSMTRASLAVIDYANSLRVSADPAALIGNPPMVLLALPQLQYADADGEDGDGKKRKRAKKIKDPNAPKRPASAYIEFQNNVRQKFRDQDPGLPYAEVLRKIADTWAALSDDEKKPWNDIVAQKTIEYEEAKANYKPSEDIQIEAVPQTTVGKDGKSYAGKKRGRKSNAEKAAMGLGDSEITKAIQAASSSTKKSKKDKKAKEPTPAAASSDDDSDDDDDDEDEDDSDDDSSSAESEPQPKKSSKQKKEQSKHKKSKH
ncbi:hypothetical protein ACM66B_000827 [Microbotryomycetes sp. NB124-2]